MYTGLQVKYPLLLSDFNEILIFSADFRKTFTHKISGFGGLWVAFWPLVLKFAGSNPAEAVGFLARLPSEGK